MDVTFKTGEGIFKYRVAGVLIHDDKLLIMKDDNSKYFYIPGGRVSMNECTEVAIKREIKEEIGIDVKIIRLLWVTENFYEEDETKEKYHEIAFYYLLEMADESLLDRGNEFTVLERDKLNLRFRWNETSQIKDLYIYPAFLKERIENLPTGIEHIVEIK